MLNSKEELKELFSRYEEEYTDYDGILIKSVNQPGLGDDTLLHLAVRHEEFRDIELLLSAGADVNVKGDVGLTPLHCAALRGDVRITQLLIKFGAKKNIPDDFGDFPIDWAERNGQTQLVDFLKIK
ncbi:ankyrin repeat domain-containing protein [bacterium SCSIO 12696]|nr:ankyrin repeat domain-containing protein [bacterium SCSIO 12696]